MRMMKVSVALNPKTENPPLIGTQIPVEVSGTSRVIFDERSSIFRQAFDNFRRDVNPSGDIRDLAGYVASNCLEGCPLICDAGIVIVVKASDTWPAGTPWCIFVTPTVTLEIPEA